jgi:hypothetical protein
MFSRLKKFLCREAPENSHSRFGPQAILNKLKPKSNPDKHRWLYSPVPTEHRPRLVSILQPQRQHMKGRRNRRFSARNWASEAHPACSGATSGHITSTPIRHRPTLLSPLPECEESNSNAISPASREAEVLIEANGSEREFSHTSRCLMVF